MRILTLGALNGDIDLHFFLVNFVAFLAWRHSPLLSVHQTKTVVVNKEKEWTHTKGLSVILQIHKTTIGLDLTECQIQNAPTDLSGRHMGNEETKTQFSNKFISRLLFE